MILNQIPDDKAYSLTYPRMWGEGRSIGATQENHVFLAELNASPQRVREYIAVTDEWNRRHPGLTYPMKPCFLGLVFRNAQGEEQTVSVMQSSRYVRCDDTDEVVRQCHEDAQWYADHGFSVIREKIEASAYGIEGIPLTDQEMQRYPTKYFEFHIKVGRIDKEDCSELAEEEVDELRQISRDFTRAFGVPIPLSYNRNRDQRSGDGKGHQRFLNARFRNIGLNSVSPKVEAIKDAIEVTKRFKVLKTISEYVWYDTFAELDRGWIDYSAEELEGMMLHLEAVGS